MRYRLLYSQTAGKQIKSLHPELKPIIKKRIEGLRESPFLGKDLKKELSGYHSLKLKKYRIIYKIDPLNHHLQIHYVGLRKDIYELFFDLLTKR